MASEKCKVDERENEDASPFKYRRKLLVAKVAFATSIAIIAAGGGFAMGFRRSRKKYAADASQVKPGVKPEEDPVKFAQRAFLQATKITFGCFAVGIGAVGLLFGVSSASGFGDKMRSTFGQNDNVITSNVQDSELLVDERDSEILNDKWEK